MDVLSKLLALSVKIPQTFSIDIFVNLQSKCNTSNLSFHLYYSNTITVPLVTLGFLNYW